MGAQSLFWILGIHQLLGTQGVPAGFWVPTDPRAAPEQPSASEHPSPLGCPLSPGHLLASGALGILAPRGDLDPHQLLGTKHLLVPITPCMPDWLPPGYPKTSGPIPPGSQGTSTCHLCQAGIQQ